MGPKNRILSYLTQNSWNFWREDALGFAGDECKVSMDVDRSGFWAI